MNRPLTPFESELMFRLIGIALIALLCTPLWHFMWITGRHLLVDAWRCPYCRSVRWWKGRAARHCWRCVHGDRRH